VILDQIGRAFMLIGDKVITASNEHSKFHILDDNITKELVIKPRPNVNSPMAETRLTLNNETKRRICELCLEHFGVSLNMRSEKKHLITSYLKFQDNN
jgi:hypothetical protein